MKIELNINKNIILTKPIKNAKDVKELIAAIADYDNLSNSSEIQNEVERGIDGMENVTGRKRDLIRKK